MKENGNGHQKIVFGDFWLDSESRTLRRGAAEIHLAKRPFEVLQFLIENRERVVSREELFDKFWDGHDVYDDALRKCVGTIRKAIDDNRKKPRFIETRYGDGFRFIGVLSENGEVKLPKTPQNPASEKPDRKTLFAFSAVVLIALVSLGFYFYSPGKAENSQISSNEPVRSIAVLPLKNLTGDANNEYFSDGITESLITELSRVRELRTVSRNSTFALKDKNLDPRETGRKLNVDAILEGSLQKRGDLYSVSVRLVSTRDGSILWTSQDYERSAANSYELQDTISCDIAAELRTTLCNTEGQKTTNADAYQAYLKGRFYWNKRTADGIKKSIEFYEQAINLDAKYAPAYAGLSESYVQGIWHVPFNSKEVLPKAKETAQKALELDATLTEAHTALANVYQLEWNWAEAERELRRAIELNPRYARAHHVLAFWFVVMQRYDEALASIRHAKELDPLNLVIQTDEANLLYAANRTDEAFEQWKKTLELDPNFAMAYHQRGVANQDLGNEAAAIADNIGKMELNGQSADKIEKYRQTATKYGLKEIYRNELRDLTAKEKRGEQISFVPTAWLFTLRGEKNQAFEYLEKAFGERSGEIVLLTSPHFASLRGDPRFADLARRAGLPE